MCVSLLLVDTVCSLHESGERGIFRFIFLFYFFHWFWFNLLLFFAASAVVHFMFLAFSPVFFCRLPKNKVVDIDATDKKIIHGNCMEFYVFLMARRRG